VNKYLFENGDLFLILTVIFVLLISDKFLYVKLMLNLLLLLFLIFHGWSVLISYF